MKIFFIAGRCIFIAFLLAFTICCHHGHCAAAEKAQPFRIVASTFPVYLFTANICVNAENIKLDLLIPASAGCPHDFALKPADLGKLADANVLVLNGAGLEDFLLKPMKDVAPQVAIIDAARGVPLIMNEVSDDSPGEHVNPHIFAAPFDAAIMVKNIMQDLARANPENAAVYVKNGAAYIKRLERLSARLEMVGKKAGNKRIVLEHDALVYLVRNAGLEISAIIENASSAARLASLEKEIRTVSPALLAGDAQYSDRILKTLSESTGIPFAELNACASGPDNAPLDYYESVMAKNLQILESSFD